MNKVKQSFNRSFFADLPSLVIWEILCKLPTKSCLTCKLVCKGWYEIIISPHFNDLRRRRYVTLIIHGYFPNRRKNFLLVEFDKASENAVEMGNPMNMIRFKSKFDDPHHKLDAVNVCNGVVCLSSNNYDGDIYICNLLTSQYVSVAQPDPYDGCYEFVVGIGMGFCAETRRFKVLRFFQTRGVHGYVAEIHTLGSGTWRKVCKDETLESYYRKGPSLNGSLHWFCFMTNCILGFHFGIEQLLRIQAPVEFELGPHAPGRSKYIAPELELSVLDSCLCCCCVSDDDRQTEVWVLKEYGVKESWVKQFVIRKGEFASPFAVLARMNDGKLLVSHGSDLALYDQETGAGKWVEINEVCNYKMLLGDVDFSQMLGDA